MAVRQAEGEFLLFLNNDVDLLTPWSSCLTFFRQVPELAAVGAVLVYPNHELQHAGVVFQEGSSPTNLGSYAVRELGLDEELVNPVKWPMTAMSFLAVTGAFLMCRKSDFDAVKGFDEMFSWAFEDVDLCLRMGALRGKFCVVDRNVLGVHHESASGGSRFVDFNLQLFRGRWASLLREDFSRFLKQTLSPQEPSDTLAQANQFDPSQGASEPAQDSPALSST